MSLTSKKVSKQETEQEDDRNELLLLKEEEDYPFCFYCQSFCDFQVQVNLNSQIFLLNWKLHCEIIKSDYIEIVNILLEKEEELTKEEYLLNMSLIENNIINISNSNNNNNTTQNNITKALKITMSIINKKEALLFIAEYLLEKYTEITKNYKVKFNKTLEIISFESVDKTSQNNIQHNSLKYFFGFFIDLLIHQQSLQREYFSILKKFVNFYPTFILTILPQLQLPSGMIIELLLYVLIQFPSIKFNNYKKITIQYNMLIFEDFINQSQLEIHKDSSVYNHQLGVSILFAKLIKSPKTFEIIINQTTLMYQSLQYLKFLLVTNHSNDYVYQNKQILIEFGIYIPKYFLTLQIDFNLHLNYIDTLFEVCFCLILDITSFYDKFNKRLYIQIRRLQSI